MKELQQTRDRKQAKPAPKKKGLRLARVTVRPLSDGSHLIVHHHEDEHGIPHHNTPEYSAASKQDVADHLMEHLPEAPGADPQDGAAGGDPAEAAEAPQE
jgi:hypothetical protein